MNDSIVIVAAARTPMGNMLGELSTLAASDLGATAIRAVIDRSGIDPEQVQEVIMGNVLPAGQGQAPARQATLKAGLPQSTGATTINKVCGSGMKATMFAHDLLLANSVEVIIAGGMESMSNAPYLMPKGRQGYRFGHAMMYDHMALDGLEDAYAKGTAMGVFAESCADKYSFSREAQDQFSLESLRRAKLANEDGSFEWETTPVKIADRKGEKIIARDEAPFKAMPDKIPTLKPAFKKDGTVTAANASSISDGAAALLLMRESKAQALGLTPIARIKGHSTHAQAPEWFTTAPVGAIQSLLHKVQWSVDEVDAFEVNEAFAVVAMAAMKELNLPHDKVNIHGGATALGHPIGASGARVIVTLLGALKKVQGKRGIASLCIGGGEAVAIAVEMI